MKLKYLILLLSLLSSSAGNAQSVEDKAVYDRYCRAMESKKALPTGELMVETARFFLGTPYVAGTLEKEPEDLVVNLHGLDCMTLVENTAGDGEDTKKAWEILREIARARSCLLKGSELDTKKAANLLLDDFRSGKLGRITLEFPEAPGEK